MLNDCYYFGNYTPNGWASIIKKTNCTDFTRVSVVGYPNIAKQQLFRRIKHILMHRKIPFTDLTVENGSMGVLCEKLKFIVVDGELVCLENSQTVNVADFIPENILKECSERTTELDIERKRTQMRCERFLTACQSINNDMVRIDERSIDFPKLNRFSSRLWKKFGEKPTGRVGVQEKRFVTCITEDGIELNMKAFDSLCKNIAVIYDKTGACSAPIVDKIRSYALGSGFDVISCICPVNLEIEHIIIPQLEFGVFTSKYYHRADFDKCEKIYSAKFHTFNSPSVVQRLDFSFKAYKALINEAFDCIKKLNELDESQNIMLAGSIDRQSFFKSVTDLIFH